MNGNKNSKPKIYDQLIGVKFEPSICFNYYYPMTAYNLNVSGPIMVFFNRPIKPSSRMLIGNATLNWNMIEFIEYEMHKSGTHGVLVLDRLDQNSTNSSNSDAEAANINSNGNNTTNNGSITNNTPPTSMKKLINRLSELFPNISM